MSRNRRHIEPLLTFKLKKGNLLIRYEVFVYRWKNSNVEEYYKQNDKVYGLSSKEAF